MPPTKTPEGWRIRITDHAGRDRRLTLPSKDLAEELELKIRQDKIRARHGLTIEQPRRIFNDFYKEWLTRYQQGSAGSRKPKARSVAGILELRKRLDPVAHLWLEDISRDKLEKLCGKIAAEGYEARAAKVCAHAKRVLKDAKERGIRIDDGVLSARIATPTPRENRAFTWEQVCELGVGMPEALRRAPAFLALTGLRIGEFCTLVEADVNLSASTLRVVDSKTEAGKRTVHLCAEARRLLAEQLLERATGTPLVWPRPKGTPYDRHVFRQLMVRAARYHIEHCEKNDLTPILDLDVRPHNLRATAVTFMAQAGVPFEICKEQLGWSDSTAVRVWQIYRRVAGWEAPEAVKKLDDLLAARTEGEAHGAKDG